MAEFEGWGRKNAGANREKTPPTPHSCHGGSPRGAQGGLGAENRTRGSGPRNGLGAEERTRGSAPQNGSGVEKRAQLAPAPRDGLGAENRTRGSAPRLPGAGWRRKNAGAQRSCSVQSELGAENREFAKARSSP